MCVVFHVSFVIRKIIPCSLTSHERAVTHEYLKESALAGQSSESELAMYTKTLSLPHT